MVTPNTTTETPATPTPVVSTPVAATYDQALANRLFELINEAMLEQVADFQRIGRMKPPEQKVAMQELQAKAQAKAKAQLDTEMAEKAATRKAEQAKVTAEKTRLAEVVKVYDGFRLVVKPKFQEVWNAVREDASKLPEVASISFTAMRKADGSGWEDSTFTVKPVTKLPRSGSGASTGNGGGRRGIAVNVSKDGQTIHYPSAAAAYRVVMGEKKNLSRTSIDTALKGKGYTIVNA